MAVPCEMLLHPELLTNEQLIFVIHERHLRVPNLNNMPRDELLEIFHQFCVPYGQRRYRDSGRGKILNKSRPLSPQANQNMTLHNNRKSAHSDHFERVKPPPDLLSGHMKRIKLETKNNDFHLKRKMSIDSVYSKQLALAQMLNVLRLVEPCARFVRIATTILLANPAVKQQCLHCCVSAWRIRQPVKLQAQEVTPATDSPPPKKDRKPITWP